MKLFSKKFFGWAKMTARALWGPGPFIHGKIFTRNLDRSWESKDIRKKNNNYSLKEKSILLALFISIFAGGPGHFENLSFL